MEEELKTNETKAKTGTKKKKGLVGIIIAIILLLAIIAGVVYYFVIYTKPEEIFKRGLGRTIQSYQKSIKEEDYKTINTKIGADVEITPENNIDESSKEIIDFINALDIALNVQMNKEEKQVVTKIESNYEDESLLNISAYIDVDKEKTYIYFKDLYNKYIEADVDDEGYESLREIFENTYTKEKQANLNKALGIIKKEVKDIAKKEYCSSQKQEITVNNKTVKANKNTISMTYEQLSKELEELFTDLKNNEEFINCYEDPEEVSENLEDIIENIKKEEDSYKNTNIKISLYTTGMLQNIVKCDIEIEEKETLIIEITKNDKENCGFRISSTDEDTTISGNINIKNINDKTSNMKIEIDVPELGKVALNINVNYQINEEIEKVDTKNTIKQDEMTEDDYNEILKKFQKTKLYELINEVSGGVLQDGTATKNNNLIQSEYEEDDDEDNTSETETNEILTYDGKQKIRFNIPNGYESSYASDNYKSFDNDDISVKVTTQNSKIEEYLADAEESKKYYEEQSDYKDVKISDTETINIDGREFSYRTIEYKYESINRTYSYRNIYICSKLSDKNIMIVEVRDSGEMSDSDLKEFLKITVE